MKGPEDIRQSPGFLALEAEAAARRLRLAGNLDALSHRMTLSNLLGEARDAAWREVDRVTDNFVNMAEDFVQDGVDWAKDNRSLVLGTSLTAMIAAGAMWYLTRRKTIPLYAAYDMEDPDMMDDLDEDAGTVGDKAQKTWGKVKSEAQHLGDRAGEAYYSARSRAADLSDAARERAAHAANLARERAVEAAEAAREAAERAREAAGEAGVWARRQPQENPATVVLVALAAGALIGALLPATRRRR
jgi:ElaB/YqjD/DUF883 family membrane-anchored ribosome-binding protein